MQKITYRAARPSDAAEMAELEVLCFSDPWRKDAIEQDVAGNPLARYIVAVSDGRIVGFGGLWVVVDQGHIIDVAVHPEFRRRGIGRALVTAMINDSKTEGVVAHTLEVRESNEAALKLYEELGFRVAGMREDYYQHPPEHALILWRGSVEL